MRGQAQIGMLVSRIRRLSATCLISIDVGVVVAAGAGGGVDRGRSYNKPPAAFRASVEKSLWQQEWVVCGRDTMEGLARDSDVRLDLPTLKKGRAVSVQYAALKLAIEAEWRITGFHVGPGRSYLRRMPQRHSFSLLPPRPL